VIVHIGYQKTGTKWLRDRLFAQPKAGFRVVPRDSPLIHELLYGDPLEFDAAASRRELAPIVEETEAAGLVPVLALGRLAGVAFSGGYDSKLHADRIKELVPDARILVVIREQRSMIVSTYKQYVKTGGTASLRGFLDPGPWQGKIPTFRFEFFEYHRLLGYYRSLFGAEGVLALPYEQLRSEPETFLRRVADFGGRPLPDDVLRRILKAKRRNTAQSALVLTLTRPLNRLAPASELNPAPIIGSQRVGAWAARARRKLDPAQLPAFRPLSDMIERQLRETVVTAVGDRYVASNRETGAMIGLDLEQFGWMV
jgi:hypothetical protein